MIDAAYCRLMARYNSWMNRQLYAACAQLSDPQRKAERGAFFGSVHGTLNHLLYGDTAWLRRFKGQPLDGLHARVEIHADFHALRTARQALDSELLDWANSVGQHWLEADFTYYSLLDGATRTRPAWLLVVHLFNHQTHHRGQLTTLLSQSGVDFGVTDLPAMMDQAP
ncbi:MAG: damage-inducible protein DinB [Nevskia sp.]|nr:damage-inducible protein DinB [Nevskia sp.]